MARGNLKLVKAEGTDNASKQRAHKPAVFGSRVFKKAKSRWYSIDLRWRGGGRPLLRDPSSSAWPEGGPTTEKKTEAREWARVYDERWNAELDEAEQRRTGRYRSLRLAREAFLAHRRAQNAASTMSGSRTAVTHLIEFVGEDADPASVTTLDLQRLCNGFLTSGYKASTVRNLRNHLVEFYKYLGVAPNPARALAIPKDDHTEIVPWYDAELSRLRKAADEIDAAGPSGPSRRLLVEYLLSHGTRIQEAAAAQWEDSNPKTNTARISKQIDRSSNVSRKTKGRLARSTTVMPEWWEFHQEHAFGLIFPAEDGTPIRYRTLYGYVREVLEQAGLKKEGEAAHQFRHTYAFMFLNRGASIDALQKCLGHKRADTTQRFYDHFTSAHAAKLGVKQIYETRRRPRGR